MRTTRARNAGVLLGIGLGAFFEGMLMHPISGFFYMVAWALTAGGVVLLWSAVRGPGPLPSGRVFFGWLLAGWGAFAMLEGAARHDLSQEWLVFATGIGFALLGGILIRARQESFIERRSGYDRRSDSPVR